MGRSLVSELGARIATRVTLLAIVLFSSHAQAALPFSKDEPKWIEVHTTHFSVVTDAGDKRGREVALRFEQMREVFGELILKQKLQMSVPITVIALKSDKQYGNVAPAKQSQAAGFYLPGTDRVYIVLNLFEADPWRSVAHALAHYLLNYNYPPVQPWFDEGMAEYFGSIYIGKDVELGGDPELQPEWHEDAFDTLRFDSTVSQSLTQLVSSPVWLTMPDLFTMKHDESGFREGTHHTLYYAQAWMLVHYLINSKKMPEVGTYFNLAINQHLPIDKAMVQAFDMSPQQMEDAVRAYFNKQSQLGIALDQSKKPVTNPVDIPQPDHLPLPFGTDDLGMAVSSIKEEEAQAMVDDVMARIPEHHDDAMRDLRRLTTDPKLDNEPAHRSMAWDYIAHAKFESAADELEKANDLNPRDPWIWYYRSVMKYRKAQTTRTEIQGLANMMQDLRAVTDWYPEMADAYNMLGVARLEGGGTNSALEAQKQAIALSPRNLEYQFNLGQIYVQGKKWDLARDVFTRLKEGPDHAASVAAKKQLDDLDTLQKYGIRPQRAGGETPAGAANSPSASASTAAAVKSASADEEDDPDVKAKTAPVKRGATGPVQFLKGKIVSSDCSKSPEAIVTVLSGMTTYKMHVADYKSLIVIGGESFSCEWANQLVSLNYRSTGKNEGELVSVELR